MNSHSGERALVRVGWAKNWFWARRNQFHIENPRIWARNRSTYEYVGDQKRSRFGRIEELLPLNWNNADPPVESGDTTSRLYAPCSNPIGGSPLMYDVGRGRQTKFRWSGWWTNPEKENSHIVLGACRLIIGWAIGNLNVRFVDNVEVVHYRNFLRGWSQFWRSGGATGDIRGSARLNWGQSLQDRVPRRVWWSKYLSEK